MIRRLLAATAAASLIAAWLASAASAVGGVLVIGDSLEVGTSPYLRDLLSGVPLTVDAQTSRPSSTGVAILRSRLTADDRVVVFDLGTNDDPAQPGALAADLSAVRQIAGDRCVVVATLNRPPYNGVSVDGLNRVVRSFATGSPPAQLVDWRGTALANPGLLGPDGVHATPGGYAARAQLVAQGIRGCLASATAPGAGAGRPEAEAPPPPRSPAPAPPGPLSNLGFDPAPVAAGLALQLPRLGALGVLVSVSLAVSRSA